MCEETGLAGEYRPDRRQHCAPNTSAQAVTSDNLLGVECEACKRGREVGEGGGGTALAFVL